MAYLTYTWGHDKVPSLWDIFMDIFNDAKSDVPPIGFDERLPILNEYMSPYDARVCKIFIDNFSFYHYTFESEEGYTRFLLEHS